MAKQMLGYTKTRFIVVIYVYIEDLRGRLANFFNSNQVLNILFCHENYLRMGWNLFKLTFSEGNCTINCPQWFHCVLCVLKVIFSKKCCGKSGSDPIHLMRVLPLSR